MIDIEKLKLAKTYIEQLANGVSPVDGSPAEASDVINNVHVSRCLFYVAGILEQVIKNNGIAKKPKKPPFTITEEQLSRFEYSLKPIALSVIAERLNDLVEPDKYTKLTYSSFTPYLDSIGVLKSVESVDGKKTKRPTEAGNALGISVENRISQNGRQYEVVVYNRDAQQFIIDNLEAILSYQRLVKAAL